MKPTSMHPLLRLTAAAVLAAHAALPQAETETPTAADNPLDIGYAYLAAGNFQPALAQFTQALQDPAQQAEAHSALGYTRYLQLQHKDGKAQSKGAENTAADGGETPPWQAAEKELNLALPMATQAQDRALQARVHGYLGLLYAAAHSEETRARAPQAFQDSQHLAQAAGDAALDYAARLHLLRLRLATPPEQRLSQLKALAGEVQAAKMADTARAELLLNIARQLKGMSGPAADAFGQTIAEETARVAAAAGLRRIEAQAEIYTAKFQQQQGQGDAALDTLRSAIDHARLVNAQDLVFAAKAAQARLMADKGQIGPALAEYQIAAQYAEDLRDSIPTTYQDGTSPFRETLEPLYRGLADMLLRQAADTTDAAEQQKLLLASIRAMEKLKKVEFEEYLNDPCAFDTLPPQTSAKTPFADAFPLPAKAGSGEPAKLDRLAINLGSASGDTAILYPILLPDRLELLLIHEGVIQRETVKGTKGFQAQLSGQVKPLWDKLAHKEEGYEPYSEQLYRWVLQPLADELDKAQAKRIVYIPDGSLRRVPLAVFHDQQHRQFAAQQYAIVTNGNLQFTPAPADRLAQRQALLVGLTAPNDSLLYDLPVNVLVGMINGKKSADTCQKIAATAGLEEQKSLVRQRLANPQCREKLLESLRLPKVDAEIDSLAKILSAAQGAQADSPEAPVRPLQNEAFTLQGLDSHVAGQPNDYVHIASHGFFGQSLDESFIVTYDKKLSVRRLEEILRPEAGQPQPISLITFSACQTAMSNEDDDRAPLGFSGIAIKTDIRNAIGALWNVPDKSTAQLMQNYYKALAANPADTAAALQQAQIDILRQEHWRHPKNWAAFILVGGW
ncbi:MAG: CHAT domain-containing protein [Candidatus Methylumidiphilus sp.]